MDISVVIVNWNTKELLLNCLDSVFSCIRDVEYEVFIVDNGSSDGSIAAVRKNYPQAILIENKWNMGFAAANNRAFKKMKGQYCLMLNSDSLLTLGAVDQLYYFMNQNNQVGMVCGQLLNNDGSKQNSVANFPTLTALLINETILRILYSKKYPSKRREYLRPIQVESCIGACIMVRKKAMDDVDFLDEDYFFYFEETDWAYRMKQKKWQVYFVPTAKIYHLQGKTAGYSAKTRIMFYRARSLFFSKWHRNIHGVMVATVFVRLLIDLTLNILLMLITIGQDGEAKGKIKVYLRLISWHLRGCPEG